MTKAKPIWKKNTENLYYEEIMEKSHEERNETKRDGKIKYVEAQI